MEIRNYDTEMESVDNQESPTLSGYAAVFSKKSKAMKAKNGKFAEMIMPGAFTRTISKPDIVALWNHNTDYPLGRTGAETLILREDEYGLNTTIILPDTNIGRDAYQNVKNKLITKMSFGFNVIRENWTKDENGVPLRQILEVDLFEVSPTTFPAYEATAIGVRSEHDINMPEIPDLDRSSDTENVSAQERKRRLAYYNLAV